jgi:hypothetical protein
VKNPYADVDWESCQRLHSVNHTHTFSANPGGDDWEVTTDYQDGQATFESMYDAGIRHFALSNYYPAKPTYPLDAYFADVPDDALGCPNAEVSSTRQRGHYCALGSRFDGGDGHEGTWEDIFADVLDELVSDDGGGIVVNHPVRTGLSVEALLERLDFDSRVLGVEAYNHRCEAKYGGTGNALSVWGELLTAGRTAYGFFNPDYHAPWHPVPEWADETLGRNVLLVPAATEAAAARAYRRGQFYGALRGSGLAFESIRATDDEIRVETTGADRIDFVSDRCVVESARDRAATYEVNGRETYVRIEARDDSGERIFSQPVLFDHGDAGSEERHT